jgi:hypothetical protein
MNVKQLIETLKCFNEDSMVVIAIDGGNGRLEVGGCENELAYKTVCMRRTIMNRLPDINEANEEDIIETVRLRIG